MKEVNLNGSAEKVGEYEFILVDIESTSESLFAIIEIRQGGNKIDEAKPGVILIDGQARNEIYVMSTPVEDVYLTYIEAPTNTMVTINVKVLPWMSLLWSGMWLLAVGIVIRLVVDYTRPRITPQSSRVQRRARMRTQMEEEEGFEESDEPYEPENLEEKSDEYYDDLIEEELRKLE